MRFLLKMVMLLAVSFAPVQAAWSEALIAVGTIRANTVIGPEHLTRSSEPHLGALTDPADVIGMEARVVLFAGRPIRPGDIGPPALVERNQIVMLLYYRSGLAISTEGRALGRAAAGEQIRVLNLASRNAVTGLVDPAGHVIVGPTFPVYAERP